MEAFGSQRFIWQVFEFCGLADQLEDVGASLAALLQVAA